MRILGFLLFLFICCPGTTSAQKLKGVQRATSTNAYEFEQFGNGLAYSGNTVIVGSYDIRWITPNMWAGRDSVQGGRAYILERDEKGDWVEQAILTSPDKHFNDRFGERGVAISGNYAMVAASESQFGHHRDKVIKKAGAVFVYVKDESGIWHFQEKLVAFDRKSGAKFGFALCMEGEYAFISAIGNNSDVNNKYQLKGSGGVYVYRRDANGRWNFLQKLAASDRSKMARFGYSLSVSGNYFCVGAYGDPATVNGRYVRQAGAVYVFKKDKDGLWHEMQKLVTEERTVLCGFGGSVCVNGEELIVGAPSEHSWSGLDSLRQTGAAYIFKLNTEGVWALTDKLTSCNPKEYDNYGISVGINGNRAVVGCSMDEVVFKDEVVANAGSVEFYEKNADERWEKTQRLVSHDPGPSEFFGYFILLGDDFAAISEYVDGSHVYNNSEKNKQGTVFFLSEFPTGKSCDSPVMELTNYQHPVVVDTLLAKDTATEIQPEDWEQEDEVEKGDPPIFNISPNPTTGRFVLSIINYESVAYSIEILSPFGVQVYYNEVSVKSLDIDLNKQNNAIYVVHVSNKYGRQTKTIILNKPQGGENRN